MTIVDLGKKVSYKGLERALSSAAKEAGLKVEVLEHKDVKYKIEPPAGINGERKYTEIKVRSTFFPLLTLTRIDRDNPIEIVEMIETDYYSKEVKAYLEAVYKKL